MGNTTAATLPTEKLLLAWLLENRCLHFDYIMQVLCGIDYFIRT